MVWQSSAGTASQHSLHSVCDTQGSKSRVLQVHISRSHIFQSRPCATLKPSQHVKQEKQENSLIETVR